MLILYIFVFVQQNVTLDAILQVWVYIISLHSTETIIDINKRLPCLVFIISIDLKQNAIYLNQIKFGVAFKTAELLIGIFQYTISKILSYNVLTILKNYNYSLHVISVSSACSCNAIPDWFDDADAIAFVTGVLVLHVNKESSLWPCYACLSLLCCLMNLDFFLLVYMMD